MNGSDHKNQKFEPEQVKYCGTKKEFDAPHLGSAPPVEDDAHCMSRALPFEEGAVNPCDFKRVFYRDPSNALCKASPCVHRALKNMDSFDT